MIRARGLTLVELLMAVLILGLTTTGALAVWNSSFIQMLETNQNNVAAQLARADIEKAKATGFWNLPTGTYSSSTSTGTYTGTLSTANDIAAWYDINGTFISYQTSNPANTAPANAVYVLVRTTTDTNVAYSGTSYTIVPTSVRVVTTTVSLVSTGAAQYTFGTELVNNGI